MDESLEGLQSPLFSGSWATDWTTHEARLRNWLSVRGVRLHSREAAETQALSLTAQAAADFERDAGPVERRVFEEGAAWCRGRWGDEQRTKLAVASALNKLTARTFRERGKRREMVQDLIDDLERLFLQGKIVDDEAKRKAFVGCFLEFPGPVRRLAAKDSFMGAIEEALVWEGEMVVRERRLRAQSLSMTLGAGWAGAGNYAGIAREEGLRGDDSGANKPPEDPNLRRSPSHFRPYASRSPNDPRIHPDRLNSPLLPHATPKSAFSRSHSRSVSAATFLAPDTPSPTTRIPTPPFVAEATSPARCSTSTSSLHPAELDERAREADFEAFAAFPYPARPSPSPLAFPPESKERADGAHEGETSSSSGMWYNSGERRPNSASARPRQARGLPDTATLPRPVSSLASYAAEKTGTTGRGSGLIGLLRRGLGGHRRSKSYAGGPIGVASSGEGEAGEMRASEGRPPKQRGKMMLGGLGLPP